VAKATDGPVVHVGRDPDGVAALAAAEVRATLAAALEERGIALLALAGGSTPRRLYAALAASRRRLRPDWSRVEFFWTDERMVAADDPASNYRLARETLLEPLAVAGARIHRIHGEERPDSEARRYAAEVAARVSGTPPRFDLVLLGVGADGHTASIFPATPSPAAREWVVASATPDPPAARVSLTLAVLNAARAVFFLAQGRAKAAIVARVLGGDEAARSLPAALVRPAAGRLVWFLDRAAASGLVTRPRRAAASI